MEEVSNAIAVHIAHKRFNGCGVLQGKQKHVAIVLAGGIVSGCGNITNDVFTIEGANGGKHGTHHHEGQEQTQFHSNSIGQARRFSSIIHLCFKRL
jgi:hypothetical protein